MKYKLVCAIIWFALTVAVLIAGLCNLGSPSWLDLGFAYFIIGVNLLNDYFEDNWRFKG